MVKKLRNPIKVFGNKVVETAGELLGAAMRQDGWANELTGLGTARDKSTHNLFVAGAKLDDTALDDIYNDNDAAALICDKVPEDAMREGFLVNIKDKGGSPKKNTQTESKVLEFLEEMDTTGNITDAWVWANVFGLGAIVLGVEDGNEHDQPLDMENIDSFTHMNVVEKPYLTPKEWYTDATKKNFGKPMTYTIATSLGNTGQLTGEQPLEIHESRMILFDGTRTSLRKRKENGGFDYSLLQRTHAVLKQFGVSWDCLAHVIQDAFQGVFKMEGLMEALAQNEHGVINARMELLDRSRSVIRALIIDAEGEEFNRQNFSFIGLDSIYDLFMMRLSMASRIPVTILMGRSPAGENATGDADFQAWYDHVAAERTRKCDKNLEKIITIALRAKNGPTKGVEPDHWVLDYPPLWQPSAKAKAEIFLNYASALQKLVAEGILLPEEVAESVFTPDGFSPEITLDPRARRMMIEQENKVFDAELAKLESEAQPDPPPPPAPVVEPPDDE